VINYEKLKEFEYTKAVEIDTKLQQLSKRALQLDIINVPEIESEEQRAAKKQLSYNSTYSLFNMLVSMLTRFRDNNKTLEVTFADKLEDKKFIEYLEKEDYNASIKKYLTYIFNRPNSFCFVSKNAEGNPQINFVPAILVAFHDELTFIFKKTDEKGNIIEDYYRVIEGVHGVLNEVAEQTNNEDVTNWYDYTIFVDKTKQKENEKPIITIIDEPIKLAFNDKEIITGTPFQKLGINIYMGSVKDSMLSDSVLLLESYQKDTDISEVSKRKHAFPKMTTIALDCTDCGGTGKISKDGKQIKCPSCKGTGHTWVKNTSEPTIVPALISNNVKPYMSDPVKYTSIDVNILNFQKETLTATEEKIIYFSTGLKNQTINTLKTATEVEENKIPLNVKNNEIIDYVENFEMWLLSIMAQIFSSKYKSVKVEYQKFYTGRIASDILVQMQTAKTLGLPQNYFNELYKDWIRAYYYKDKEKQELLIKSIENGTKSNQSTEN